MLEASEHCVLTVTKKSTSNLTTCGIRDAYGPVTDRRRAGVPSDCEGRFPLFIRTFKL